MSEAPKETPIYANHAELRSAGIDPSPKHGDVVQWVSNGERWTVCEYDDLVGPTSLAYWPDGAKSWLLVRLLKREEKRC